MGGLFLGGVDPLRIGATLSLTAVGVRTPAVVALSHELTCPVLSEARGFFSGPPLIPVAF